MPQNKIKNIKRKEKNTSRRWGKRQHVWAAPTSARPASRSLPQDANFPAPENPRGRDLGETVVPQ